MYSVIVPNLLHSTALLDFTFLGGMSLPLCVFDVLPKAAVSVKCWERCCLFQDRPPFRAADEAALAVSRKAGRSAGDIH